MATTATTRFNQGRLHEARAGSGRTVAIKLPVSVTYVAGDILGELIGNNEVQLLTPGGTISGGTWTLTFGAATSAAIAYNATAATIQAALELMSTIGVGNILVTGGPISSGVVTLTFVNKLGYTDVAAVTVGTGSLTGSSPTLTPSTSTAGSAGTPGTFKKYSASATDGSQIPKGLLEWDATTDSNGMVVGENGSLFRTASMYEHGAFKTQDVPNMTESIVALLLGRFLNGTSATGATYGGVFEF